MDRILGLSVFPLFLKRGFAMPNDNIVGFPKFNPQSVPGMSAEFIQIWNEFGDGLQQLVNEASAAGLPPQLILDQLDCMHADILDAMRGDPL